MAVQTMTVAELAAWVRAGGWRNVCVVGDTRRRFDLVRALREQLPGVRMMSGDKVTPMHDLVLSVAEGGAGEVRVRQLVDVSNVIV